MALALHDVRSIDPCGGHTDEHLAFTGLGNGPGGGPQLLRAAVSGNLDHRHLRG